MRFLEGLEEISRRFGLDTCFETDPALLRDILKKDMFLDDFAPLAPLIAPYLEAPSPFGPFLRRVRDGILGNHPATADFVCRALEAGLLDDAHAYRERIRRIAHQTFLLEQVVQGMMDDVGFMRALLEHYAGKRRQVGVGGGALATAWKILARTRHVFATAKMLTVDVAIEQYLGYREKGDLSESDLAAKNRGLFVNVMEATLADRLAGFRDNALAGAVLAANPVLALSVEGPRRDVKQRFVEGWTNLYQSWDLAFMTDNLNGLDMLYPKLLIPSLLEADPEDYLYRRGLALWVTSTLILLQKFGEMPRERLGPFPEAGRLWGEVNLKYAREVNARGSGSAVGDGYLLWMRRQVRAALLGRGRELATPRPG